MKKPKFSLDLRKWQAVIFGVIALLVATGLYVVKLGWPGSLTRGEQAVSDTSASLSGILHNPLNGVYKLVDFAWLQVPGQSLAFSRLASVCFALAAVVIFYCIAKRWHGRLNAAYGTIIFAASTWMLLVGRLGDGQIMLLLTPLALLLLASWLHTTERHDRAILLYGIVTALALFTPGAVWFMAALAILLGKALAAHLKQARPATIIGAGIVLAVSIAFLAFSLWRDTSLVMPWIGVPYELPEPLTILRQWAGSIGYLFVRGPSLGGQWLAHTPVLDVATTGLVAFGVFLYVRHFKNMRTRLLLVFFVLGSLLVALNGAIALGFVVGTIYLVATTGFAYFQHLWFHTFPHNPIARNLATILMLLLVLFITTYHTQRYFVAWHRSPATQSLLTNSTVPRPDLIQ